jgi:hypothetical protein
MNEMKTEFGNEMNEMNEMNEVPSARVARAWMRRETMREAVPRSNDTSRSHYVLVRRLADV